MLGCYGNGGVKFRKWVGWEGWEVYFSGKSFQLLKLYVISQSEIRNGAVVQWIVYGFPEPRMKVRFLPALQSTVKREEFEDEIAVLLYRSRTLSLFGRVAKTDPSKSSKTICSLYCRSH